MKRKARSLIFCLGVLVFLTACGSSAARYNNEGNEDFEARQYPEALDDYIAAQRENPDLAAPYYNAGNTYHRQGNLEAAEAQTKQSIRSAEEELSQKAYYNLGNTYFKAEDLAGGHRGLQGSAALRPQ